MENQKPAIKPIAYKYGFYSALVTIVILMIQYVIGVEQHWAFSVASTIASILIFYYGINEYKKLQGNKLSIKDGLKTGMGISLIGGLISAIYIYFHYSFLQPEFLEGKREEAIDGMMTKNPNLSVEQLETAMTWINATTSEFFAATMTVIASLFFGFILSLIISAILKRD